MNFCWVEIDVDTNFGVGRKNTFFKISGEDIEDLSFIGGFIPINELVIFKLQIDEKGTT